MSNLKGTYTTAQTIPDMWAWGSTQPYAVSGSFGGDIKINNNQTNQCLYDPWDCAEAIRARGNRTKTSKDLCDND